MLYNEPVRRPTLSPSKLTTYLACPTMYLWTYVDSRGNWYRRARRNFSFGTSLHHALQRFHDTNDIGIQTVDQAVAALEENWVEAGYSSQDEMLQDLAEGKQILERHIERHWAEAPTQATLYVEKTLTLDLGRFVLRGRVDRVDEHEDGTLEVIDYKTGRESVEAEDVAGSLAMSCYQLLLKEAVPGHRVIATIVAVRSGAKASSEMDETALAQLREDLVTLGNEILDRDWQGHEPVGKALCSGCDFLPLCRRSPGFTAPDEASPRSTSRPEAS